jgi:hypothetical protein
MAIGVKELLGVGTGLDIASTFITSRLLTAIGDIAESTDFWRGLDDAVALEDVSVGGTDSFFRNKKYKISYDINFIGIQRLLTTGQHLRENTFGRTNSFFL